MKKICFSKNYDIYIVISQYINTISYMIFEEKGKIIDKNFNRYNATAEILKLLAHPVV
ncbi:hypothetical protein [Clostridium ljungdahlii]|uniref:Uncharacterized protein n=1 Tax=Clostridium ljungdahlii TaxID=1538 RepID=A0A166SBB4_9CLOT|nr:hypothetical protein [Clostridium ljungdahlii]OAA91937.1 hypothetical protein WY13_00339 [Clostridium ljungdahlii]